MESKEIVIGNGNQIAALRKELLRACSTVNKEPASSEKRKRAKREVSQMSLSDNALFVTLMKSTVLFNHVLSTIMGREMSIVGEITEVNTEYSIELGMHRNVRLDAVAKDSCGKLYNIEMENSTSRATPKRARYYASASDVNSLRVGDDFEVLSDHCHIFLTDGDAIGNGKTVNVFTRRNQDGEELGDGSLIFFVNMRCDSGDMLGKLLRSMRESELEKIEDIIVKNALSLVKEETEMQISIYDTKV
ncbi:MAG: PD-(D/E)XK nuclease family transposase, partial [Spirochaetales bacterium]|nr:PD-(D/E)XK nuclease family transposase [Spirochaetales bacterium]